MKLKKLCIELASEEPPSKLQLVSCKDADKHMDSFLERLKESEVSEIFIRTDFLTSMSEDNGVNFFNTLAKIPSLEDLTIQSSSRFHIESIPVSGLLSLRHATKLRRLVLEDMQVTAMNKAFISGLGIALQNHTSLKEISMTNFFANDWANTESDVLENMIVALSTLPKLGTLEFSGCGSHALRGQDVRLLSPGALSKLMGLPCLTHLQLSFLELDDRHFEAISSQIRKNRMLHTISLDYHKLESDGFRHMMQAMETNSSVKTLSLRSLRDIGDQGYAEAMSMLQLNYGIENLSVTASASQQAQIDLYLRMNGAGRALLREPTASMSQWVDVIANSNDDIDVVRHLLQETPGLCNAAALPAESNDPASFDDG
jgi:hypothetical protein